MPIIFSVVSRGIITLAKHAICEGNFDDVTEHILAIIPLHNDELTYSQGPYHFHYIRTEGITYLCVTDDAFQRSRAFLFLLEIRRKFQDAYGNGLLSALPHVINNEFSMVLANEMHNYNTSNDIDTSTRAKAELNELKEIMAKSIDSTGMNGERARLLVNNVPRPSFVVITEEETRAIRKKNIIFWSFLIIVHVIVIWGVGAIICGPTWSKCSGNGTLSD